MEFGEGRRHPRRRRRVCASISIGLLALAASARAAEPAGAAGLLVGLNTGTTISIERADIVDRPIRPGSVMKVAAIAAALEQHVIDPHTGIVCTRTIVVDGHRLTCTHPDLHRPLTPAEALAQSCNVYVATVATRLPRTAFDDALTGLGLAKSSPAASVQASALGIEGNRMRVRSLVQAIARIATNTPDLGWSPATLATVRDGLRMAAVSGTAAALGAAGIDALAKTGTVDAGGVSQGLVVGVTPSTHPTIGFAMIVAGGGGADAAALAAQRLRAHASAARDAGDDRTSTVRVGIAQRDGRYVVQTMSLDAYVAGVVAGEAATGAAPAALDALAIAVRTYALANLGRHAGDGFDLCDLTHCQVLRRATAATSASAERTTGMHLEDNGRPAQVFYTASCGGHTERPSAVWRGALDPPFLPARADSACRNEPRWQSDISARDLVHALNGAGFAGTTIRGITVTSRSSSGRVAWLRIEGMTPDTISGENLRTVVGRVLGWQHLRSTLFEVTRTAAGFRFAGRGAGHGVGLCVLGAASRAAAGESADAILRDYYPGLVLKKVAGDGSASAIRIVLPRQDEPLRSDLRQAAARALRDVEGLLEARSTSPIVIRFHPTVESYQRATRLPWFTAGATHGSTIDLLPARALQARGILDGTLRHELAHVLTSAAMTGAPRWRSEGVAVWAERRGRGVEEPPAAAGRWPDHCPADTDFAHAASPDALRRVYDDAVRCYEKEAKAGASWRRTTP